MFNWLLKRFKKQKPVEEIKKPESRYNDSQLLTSLPKVNEQDVVRKLNEKYYYELKPLNNRGVAMDAAEMKAAGIGMDALSPGLKSPFNLTSSGIPPQLLDWYGLQSFISFQICAILSQNWLINLCCTMPPEDAARKGFNTTMNSGQQIPIEVQHAIRQADKRYRLNKNLVQFARFNRIYGIRIAMFKIKTNDPEFYFKPFNIDGVTPGSYMGISQVDPYWITPQLDAEAAGDPSSIDFYEPTWWRISGKLIHKSHLIIVRLNELPDILKPGYVYAGVSLPQQIYERVYAAERTANEGPALAMTKRLKVLAVDIAEAIADQAAFQRKLEFSTFTEDNHSTRVIDLGETMQMLETSLADVDTVIMTQYQLDASISRIPATKLLQTSPKGFNGTGEYEERNYHEYLGDIQTHEYTPLIERHHMLLIKSEIAPKFGMEPFETEVVWNPPTTVTPRQQAEINELKMKGYRWVYETGAIDGTDIRKTLINDPLSGFNGLDDREPEREEDDDIENMINNEYRQKIPNDPENKEV